MCTAGERLRRTGRRVATACAGTRVFGGGSVRACVSQAGDAHPAGYSSWDSKRTPPGVGASVSSPSPSPMRGRPGSGSMPTWTGSTTASTMQPGSRHLESADDRCVPTSCLRIDSRAADGCRNSVRRGDRSGTVVRAGSSDVGRSSALDTFDAARHRERVTVPGSPASDLSGPRLDRWVGASMGTVEPRGLEAEAGQTVAGLFDHVAVPAEGARGGRASLCDGRHARSAGRGRSAPLSRRRRLSTVPGDTVTPRHHGAGRVESGPFRSHENSYVVWLVRVTR